MANFAISDICTAFSERSIGTRVTRKSDFLKYLSEAVDNYDTDTDRIPGQHLVHLPVAANECVIAGIGRRTDRPQDYVLRTHRDRVNAYLSRELAEPASGVACVVYTLDAYLADPDVDESEDVGDKNTTHVVVAVLAFAGPGSPLTPWRFVHNLAGGNREALAWNADEIRTKAEEIRKYWEEWCSVAD